MNDLKVDDYLIFTPDDVDLDRSPLRNGLTKPCFVLGTFNPGLTRLPHGNLLLMVRVAEALQHWAVDGRVFMPMWEDGVFKSVSFDADGADLNDPRQFIFHKNGMRLLGLTSLSWLLPVELTPDGREIVAVHYEKALAPERPYQSLGLEDPRISHIDGRWYLTCCSVSPERQATSLYISENGIDYQLDGLIFDHQNKDVVVFEGRVSNRYMALTRPLGDAYFVYPEESPFASGPAIHLAASPDIEHWRPVGQPLLRPEKSMGGPIRLGGGSPPILTRDGWLILYHGVQADQGIGTYRTYWALLDRDDPSKIVRNEKEQPLLTENEQLLHPLSARRYLKSPVVFTTGLVSAGDDFIIASGEADLACRLTHVPKSRFGLAGWS